jgi:hypothetical protein
MRRHLAAIVARYAVVGLAAATGVGCAPKRQVWFTPNLGSPDMLALFSQPERWELARSHVDVFKFYTQHLVLTSEECPRCGPNLFTNFAAAGAFSKLGSWRIPIAVEIGVVKPPACVSDSTADQAERAMDNVAAQGGVVAYLAMDEPLVSAAACGYGTDDVARETARFVHRIQASRPGVVIGDIEPFPLFDVAALRAWLDALSANGVKPAFFHFDVDHGLLARRGEDAAADLQALKALSAERVLPFGLLMTGQDDLDDAGYYQNVIAWTRTVATAVGDPDEAVFQSFSQSATGTFDVPLNLPEDDPAAASHSRLINEAFEILKP